MSEILRQTQAEINEFDAEQLAGFFAAAGLCLARPIIAAFASCPGFNKIRPWRWSDTNIFVIAAFTDYLDGEVARKTSAITSLGKKLDPEMDKIMMTLHDIVLWRRGQLTGADLALRLGCDALNQQQRSITLRTNPDADTSARMSGKAATALRLAAGAFSASPLGERYPQVARGLQRTVTAVRLGACAHTLAHLHGQRRNR